MEYDVLAAQVAMANAEPEVTRAQNDVRLVRDRLRYLLGIQEDFGIQGELVCALKPPAPPEEVMERARQQRPEVVYYSERLGVFKELVTGAKAGDKPNLYAPTTCRPEHRSHRRRDGRPALCGL